jgi:hypothetical protein
LWLLSEFNRKKLTLSANKSKHSPLGRLLWPKIGHIPSSRMGKTNTRLFREVCIPVLNKFDLEKEQVFSQTALVILG